MAFFIQMEALLYLKNACLPLISFWMPRALAKFYVHCINIPVLLGTIHWKPEYLEMRRTYAQ